VATQLQRLPEGKKAQCAISCRRRHPQQSDVDLAAMKHPPTTLR
jgi:hypothetical protein